MKNLYLIVIGFLLYQISYSQSEKTINWETDLDYISNELPKKHYNLFAVKSEIEFKNGIDKIRKDKDNLKNIEIGLKLQQLIASFGDSHTNVAWSSFKDRNQQLPLNLYWFADGIFITATTQENAEILGHKIVSINKYPIKTITDSLSTLISIDNNALVKKTIPNSICSVQVLEYFKFVKDGIINLELQDTKGNTKLYLIKPEEINKENSKSIIPDSLPICDKDIWTFFNDYYQQKDKLYYIQYNKCWSKELQKKYRRGKYAKNMPSFAKFEKSIFRTIKKESIEKIVFDIRYNGGGSSLQATELIGKIAKYSKEKPNLKIYVVIGRSTFSSAIINAMDFKKWTNAIFVGEDTGGKPNHFGEVKHFTAPSSGINIFYSTKFLKRENKGLKTISPDIKIETSFENYTNGIDPVYEWIKTN